MVGSGVNISGIVSSEGRRGLRFSSIGWIFRWIDGDELR